MRVVVKAIHIVTEDTCCHFNFLVNYVLRKTITSAENTFTYC